MIAYEIDPTSPSARGKISLSYPQVEVRARSGIGEELPKAHAVYVSAAASYPRRMAEGAQGRGQAGVSPTG